MKKWPKTRLEPAGGMLTMLDWTAGSAASGRGAGLAETRRALQQPGQADQVVRRRREGEGPADPFGAAEPGLGLQRDRLDPGERFLDPLARPLAREIAAMTDGPVVDARGAAGGVLGDMRRRVQRRRPAPKPAVS